jgi:hypothetical protein
VARGECRRRRAHGGPVRFSSKSSCKAHARSTGSCTCRAAPAAVAPAVACVKLNTCGPISTGSRRAGRLHPEGTTTHPHAPRPPQPDGSSAHAQ